MTKPITKFDDAFDVLYESGGFHLRLKEGVTPETLLSEKLEKLKILVPGIYSSNK